MRVSGCIVAVPRSADRALALIARSSPLRCLNIHSLIITWSWPDTILDDHSLISVLARTETHVTDGLIVGEEVMLIEPGAYKKGKHAQMAWNEICCKEPTPAEEMSGHDIQLPLLHLLTWLCGQSTRLTTFLLKNYEARSTISWSTSCLA